MRTSHIGLAVFTGLAAVVAADGLPPASIPIACANICGPIVELTSICTPQKSSKRWAKEQVIAKGWVPKLAVEPVIAKRNGQGERGQKGRVGKRSFSIIRAAPTSFPPSASTADPPSESAPAAAPPAAAPPAAAPPPPVAAPPAAAPPPAAVPPPAAAPAPPPPPPPAPPAPTIAATKPKAPEKQAPLSTASPSTSGPSEPLAAASPQTTKLEVESSPTSPNDAALQTNGGAQSISEMKGWTVPAGAEEKCVCVNDSFDVAKIAALCASCVQQEKDTDAPNNAMVVVSACNFSAEKYTPADDSLADNIRIQATKPTPAWGSQAGVTGAGVAQAARFDMVYAVAVAVGSIMLL